MQQTGEIKGLNLVSLNFESFFMGLMYNVAKLKPNGNHNKHVSPSVKTTAMPSMNILFWRLPGTVLYRKEHQSR